MRYCIVCGQESSSNCNLFRIPKEEDRHKKWCEGIGKYIPPGGTICSKHFDTEWLGQRFLRKGAVPSKNPKTILPMPVLTESISIPDIETGSKISILESTHQIQEEDVTKFDKCFACLEQLPNELCKAPVTMLCFDDKTVKDGLNLFLVPQLVQENSDFNAVEIKDEDFVCDSCFMSLRSTIKFMKKCLQSREHDLVSVKADSIQTQKYETGKDMNYCGFLPLQYSKVPYHNEIVSFETAVPECLLALQENGVTLLQNCKTYDNFYENKRVLLLGNQTYVKCSLCEEQFVTEEKMLEHLDARHNLTKAHLLEPILYEYEPDDYSNVCAGCDKTFRTVKSKNIHMQNCRMFVCPYCEKIVNWSKLADHTKREHGDPNPFKCHKCNLQQCNYFNMRSHICNGRKCEDCGKVYYHENRFKEHKKNFCRLKTCRQCKKKISLSIYEKHMEAHNVPCKICGTVFQSRIAMQKHMNGHKSYLCPICGKECKVLSSHMLIHDKNRTKSIPCSQCPKLFYRPHELRIHVKQIHEAKKVVCEICGDQVRDYYIKQHYKAKHANVEYKCEICSEKFINSREYKRHVRRHTGALEVRRKSSRKPTQRKKYDFRRNDPVFCKHCLKSFKNMVYLEIHMKTHTKSCRVRCRFCPKTYLNVKCRRNHELRHHKKISTVTRKEKVLPGLKTTSDDICTCEVCGQLFENIDILNAHIEDEHNISEESGPLISELAKEVLLGFQALDYEESLFFKGGLEASDNVEIILAQDSDS